MRWLDFGARNRLSDKGCHPFYEFPYDSAKICSFSLFAKPILINSTKVYQTGRLLPPVLTVVEDVALAFCAV